jgi:AcrR family transcriptional regulator
VVRRRLDPQARRAAILRAAVEAFDELGLEHVNLETVAERAGVSRALVYTYFTNRLGLIRAVFEEILVEIELALDQALQGASTPEDRIARWMTTLAGYARAHPNRWQVVRWSVRPHDEDGRDGMGDLLRRIAPAQEWLSPESHLGLSALVGMVDWTVDTLDEATTRELATLAWVGTSSVPAVRLLWQGVPPETVDNLRNSQGSPTGPPQATRPSVVPGMRPEG